MSLKFKFLAAAAAVVMLTGVALPVAALAQSSYDASYDDYYTTSSTTQMTEEEAAAFAAIMSVWLGVAGCIGLIYYVYMAIVISATAKKVGITEGTWMAWVPIANVYLMTKIANLEILHFILSLIVPLWILYVLAKMFERRGMSPWMVLLFFIPIGDLIALGMLAWSNKTAK
jgi:hypothetical protein